MKSNHTSPKSSLKDIQKSLDATQQLTAKSQGDIKGGCSSCQDIRRPPSADGNPRGGNNQWGNW